MCLSFGCNLQIIFVTFSQFELSLILAQLLPKHIDTGYLEWHSDLSDTKGRLRTYVVVVVVFVEKSILVVILLTIKYCIFQSTDYKILYFNITDYEILYYPYITL